MAGPSTLRPAGTPSPTQRPVNTPETDTDTGSKTSRLPGLAAQGVDQGRNMLENGVSAGIETVVDIFHNVKSGAQGATEGGASLVSKINDAVGVTAVVYGAVRLPKSIKDMSGAANAALATFKDRNNPNVSDEVKHQRHEAISKGLDAADITGMAAAQTVKVGTKIVGKLMTTPAGEKIATKAAEKLAATVAGRAATSVGSRVLAGAIPALNIAIAGADIANAVAVCTDPKASKGEKAGSVVTALGSAIGAAATFCPPGIQQAVGFLGTGIALLGVGMSAWFGAKREKLEAMPGVHSLKTNKL